MCILLSIYIIYIWVPIIYYIIICRPVGRCIAAALGIGRAKYQNRLSDINGTCGQNE